MALIGALAPFTMAYMSSGNMLWAAVSGVYWCLGGYLLAVSTNVLIAMVENKYEELHVFWKASAFALFAVFGGGCCLLQMMALS